MAKRLEFTYGGKTYTLEFTRRTVAQMERNGFVASDVETKPMTTLPALFEGAFLGGISFMFETSFPGIVQTAIKATLLCVAVMLILFKTGLVKVTDKLRAGIIMCTATIAGIYLIDLLLSLFGIRVPAINAATPLGIGISLAIVAVASFNLLLDFDFIYEASARLMPKHIEWYGAFGLMVTIVWLYIEILKLLAKAQRRR